MTPASGNEHDAAEGERPPAPPPPCRHEKALATMLIVAVLGAVLFPIAQNWSDRPRDNFPLSYYPMFTNSRTNEYTVTHLVGIDHRGEERILPYWLAGRGGFNQVRKQIRKWVRNGEATRLGLVVAGRVAQRDDDYFREVVAVEVVTGVYRLDDYFLGSTGPVRREVHARVAVENARR